LSSISPKITINQLSAMTRFTTRVELHHASDDDYEVLHSAMKTEGFSRTITFGDVSYHLPTAEYNRSGELTTDQVLESAKRAAATTGRNYAVLVTESNSRKIFGLEQV
jgi:hypothetical protein